jgi:hypothetical protein
MQRRAVAVSVAFFLVVAAGAYALIGAAQQPTVSIEDGNVDQRLTSGGQTFTVDGVEYNVTDIGGESATVAWTNTSATLSATLENDSTIPYRGGNYTVLIPNESDPAEFTLREQQTVDRETVTQNGTTYVVVEGEGGNRTLVPRSEYLDDPTTYTFRQGDSLDYRDNSTTVASIAPSGVTLQWTGERTKTVDFAAGENVTLGDEQTFVAHFPSSGTAELTQNYDDYQSDIDRIEYFHERVNGLWGVVILSGIASILLIGMAYMPSRY